MTKIFYYSINIFFSFHIFSSALSQSSLLPPECHLQTLKGNCGGGREERSICRKRDRNILEIEQVKLQQVLQSENLKGNIRAMRNALRDITEWKLEGRIPESKFNKGRAELEVWIKKTPPMSKQNTCISHS